MLPSQPELLRDWECSEVLSGGQSVLQRPVLHARTVA